MTPDVDELLRRRAQDAQVVEREQAAGASLAAERAARAAYDAYAKCTGGRTFDGHGMLAWGDLPERIRVAWIEAVDAGIDEYERAVAERMRGFIPRGTR